MTRKDYELIAAALAAHIERQNHTAEREVFHEIYCSVVARALASDNPCFDRARFLKACGLEVAV